MSSSRCWIKLFKKKKKPKTKGSLSRAKGIEVDSSTSESSDGEDANFEKPLTLPEKEGSDAESDHSKRISKLEKHLEALTNRKGLQEAGVVWSYSAECDLVPYLPKFKAPTVQAFDSNGSPNQHIYFFKSQSRNVVSNDVILAYLFTNTLKGLAFEWFMKLPNDSIKNWDDLEKFFLTRFFKDDSKVTIPTLLATKQ